MTDNRFTQREIEIGLANVWKVRDELRRIKEQKRAGGVQGQAGEQVDA